MPDASQPGPPEVPPTPPETKAWQPSIEPPPLQQVWQPGADVVEQPQAPAWEPEPAEVAQPMQESWAPKPTEVAQPEQQAWQQGPAQQAWQPTPTAYGGQQDWQQTAQPGGQRDWRGARVPAKRPRIVTIGVVITYVFAGLGLPLHLVSLVDGSQFGSASFAAAVPWFVSGLLLSACTAVCAYFAGRRHAWARIALAVAAVASSIVSHVNEQGPGWFGVVAAGMLFFPAANAWFKRG